MFSGVGHRPGSIEVQSLGPRLLFTRFSGWVTAEHSEQGWTRFSAALRRGHRPIWVSDALDLSGFEPRTLSLGPRWFAAFRKQGGRHCLVASRWPRAMMAASSMSLGSGVRLHSFGSVDEAKAAALELLGERD